MTDPITIRPDSLAVTQAHHSLLEENSEQRQLLETALALSGSYLGRYLAKTERFQKELHAEEQSYLTFTSAENLWGLSYLAFGRTGSSYRVEAADKVLSYLRDLRFAWEILHESIKQGQFPERNTMVQKFLASPFADLVDLRRVMADPAHATPNPENRQNQIAFGSGLVTMAKRLGSDELAIYYIMGLDGLSDADRDRLLPGVAEMVYETFGRRLMNAAISLPQMAANVAGVGLGAAVARSTTASAAVTQVVSNMGRAKILLPGALVLGQGSNVGFVSYLFRIPVNLLTEAVKFNFYASMAHFFGGQCAMDAVGLLYLGAVGATSGHAQQAMRRVLGELARGDSSGVVAAMIRRGLHATDQWYLAEAAALHSSQRPFRLAGTQAAATTNDAINDIRTTVTAQIEVENAALFQAQQAAEAAERAAREAVEQAARLWTLAKRRLEAPVAAAEKFAQEKLSGDAATAFMTRVRTLADIQSPHVVINAREAIYELLQSTKAELREAATRAARAAQVAVPAPSPKKTFTPTSQQVAEGPKNAFVPRDVRKATHVPRPATPSEAAPAVQRQPSPPDLSPPTSATPPPGRMTSMVERWLQTPPETLTDDIVTTVSRGRIVFKGDLLEDITQTYQTIPEMRGAILRRLHELATMSGRLGNEWKKISAASEHCVGGRVGLYRRILARRQDDGTWQVYKFTKRGDLDTESWY